jgi:hypothetical protein
MIRRGLCAALLAASTGLGCPLAVEDDYTVAPLLQDGAGGDGTAGRGGAAGHGGSASDGPGGGDSPGGGSAGGPAQKPPPPSCSDGAKNPGETDIDCGGHSCAPCPLGKGCKDNADCETDKCSSHTCST